MKVSQTKTDWLAIKAGVTSQWDSCNFILLKLSDPFLKFLRERIFLAKVLSTDPSFRSISFWVAPEGWYIFSYDDDPAISTNEIEDLFEQADSCYIEFENEELEKLAVPQQRVDVQRLKIRSDGSASFSANGKYTDEEFWTSEFDIED
jgi:hypothetical protein